MTVGEARVPVRGRSIGRAIVRYAPIVVPCAVLIGVATTAVLRSDNDNRAEVRALIVAQQLVVTVDELQASVTPIFRFGGVAEDAVAEYQLDVSPGSLKGNLVDVVVVPSTPVIQVVGRDVDPTRAAQRANAVAHSLAAALNQAGGIGNFSVVEDADPARADLPASVPAPLFGVVIGLISVLAIYSALIYWLRPMFTAEELAEVSTSPIIMTIGLSRDDAHRLAEVLIRRHPTWLMVGLNSHHSDRLLSLVRKSNPDLEISATELKGVAVTREDQWDSLVVLVVSAGALQGTLRSAEAVVGKRLAATVMLGVS